METKFLDDFSQEVWQTTYKHHSDSDINATLRRVARAAAAAEKTDALKQEWEEKFYELLSEFKITSGGRITANAGTNWKGVTLMNCFVGPKPKYDQDSLDGILATLRNQCQTLKSEGGWGMNFSFIRPRGSFILGIGVESPGAVKYMEIFDKTSDVITCGSGKQSKKKEAKGKIRKGAMMGVLDVWHPDIEEYVTAKLPYYDDDNNKIERLKKFNISVNCSDAFMNKVSEIRRIKREIAADPSGAHEADLARLEELEKWNLVFPETSHPNYKSDWDGNIDLWISKGFPVRTYKTVRVSDLWELIMQSTYTRNDPGVLFLDRANKTHCWNYGGAIARIAATNPCGEQCLPFGFVCNLASLNLVHFVTEKGRIAIDKIKKFVPYAVRFLDNVNDITNAPLPEYAESIRKYRRIGLGVMGWGSALYLMKTRFASDAAEEIKKEFMSAICYTAIEASIDLAAEKGMFEGCDPEKHSEAHYFKQINLPAELKAKMKKHGIRNSALFSIQPTGNTSIFANVVSGGLEPIFLHEYVRTVICNHAPQDLVDAGLLPKYWEGEFKETDMFKYAKEGDETILRGVAKDGTVYKIDKNRGLTKEVLCTDYAVRMLKAKGEWNPKADWAVTTNNLSADEHIRDLKGFGIWIDSSMSKTVNLPKDYPYDKFKDIYLDAYETGYLKGITTYREGTMTNVLAAVKKDVIQKTTAPKRPASLKGELHHFTVDGLKYYCAVGLIGEEGQPFEIFTGKNESKKEIFIPKVIHRGTINKLGKGKYVFIYEDKEYNLTNGHTDDAASALSRILSASLRHGCDLKFLVEQLLKTEGRMLSFSKVLARTLKRYIKDGELSTEDCPDCGSDLVYVEGCKKCNNCGHSKCG
jgi:ribonucleoside-diphosphate reductase alpha chain